MMRKISCGVLMLLVALYVQPTETDTPRTSWGTPDLNGMWNFKTATPLERPDEFAEKGPKGAPDVP